MEVSNFKESLQSILENEETILELYLVSKDKQIKFSSISENASLNLLELFKESIDDILLGDDNERNKSYKL